MKRTRQSSTGYARKRTAPQTVTRYRSRVPRALPLKPLVSPVGFPTQMKIRHKYTECINLTSTTGASANYSFSCNGMYDPNISGTGHQPSYFDVCGTIYNHYTVVWSRIRVSPAPSTTLGAPMQVSVFINDDSTVAGGFSAAAEQSDSVTELVQINSGAAPKVLTLTWSSSRIFGGDPLSNDNLAGNTGANPSEQSMFSIVQGPADSASTQTLFYLVELEYIAIWDELKDFASN